MVPLRGKENRESLLCTPLQYLHRVRRKHYPVFTHPAAIEWPRPHRTITIRTSRSCVTAIDYDLRLSKNCGSRQRLPLPLPHLIPCRRQAYDLCASALVCTFMLWGWAWSVLLIRCVSNAQNPVFAPTATNGCPSRRRRTIRRSLFHQLYQEYRQSVSTTGYRACEYLPHVRGGILARRTT